LERPPAVKQKVRGSATHISNAISQVLIDFGFFFQQPGNAKIDNGAAYAHHAKLDKLGNKSRCKNIVHCPTLAGAKMGKIIEFTPSLMLNA
jgi:hypothetical protein